MTSSVERARLETLRSYEILDTPREESFDRIVQIAAATCDCPIALLSLVDDRRQWFKAAYGLGIAETIRDDSFCAHAVERGETLVVRDAAADTRFEHNPLVLSTPNIRFYAGVPVHAANGLALGALCVIDRSARHLERAKLDALAALAREVEAQLELRRALRDMRGAHAEKERLTLLLVHDLRNPLTALLAGMHVLQAEPELPAEAREVVDGAVASGDVLRRMLLNVLDVARSDAGKLVPTVGDVDLAAFFDAVVRSAAAAGRPTGHDVAVSVDLAEPRARTDAALLRRVVDNLVDNAFKYAPPGTRVRVDARAPLGGPLVVRVVDEGPGVPEEMRDAVFGMHARAPSDRPPPRESYGFGLASCRVAVEALGGRIGVEPAAPRGAAFWFEIPIR